MTGLEPLSCVPIALAIVDEAQLVREGLSSLFRGSQSFAVVAAGRTWTEVNNTAACEPSVVLLDVKKWSLTDWDALSRPSPNRSRCSVVALDEQVRDVSLRQVLARGWNGYATTSDSFAEISTIVHAAVHGGQTFSLSAQARLQRTNFGWKLCDNHGPGLHMLTRRELEILSYLAGGHSAISCGKALGISPATVDNHKANMMRKLKVRRQIELLHLAIDQGLVTKFDLVGSAT